MKYGFKFAQQLGTVYKSGNILFTPDGNSVISPIGNRVSVFDLARHTTITFEPHNQSNISQQAISHDGSLLITIDTEGRLLLINFKLRVVLGRLLLKQKAKCVAFSADDKYFAVGFHKVLEVWKTPKHVEFFPFAIVRSYSSDFNSISSICWSKTSSVLVTGSKDCIVRVYDIEKTVPTAVLAGHTYPIVQVLLQEGLEKSVYAVGRNGRVLRWDWSDQQQKWNIKWSKFIWPYKEGEPCWVRCASFNMQSNLLVAGRNTGDFVLINMVDFTEVHTLSVTQKTLDAVAVNPSGDWLAFASSELGQLLVWEWRSEQYVMRQQGHLYDMNSICYSSDGQLVVTGSDDGKVKVWNTSTGFCFVTFADHKAPVSAVQFSPKQGLPVVVSAGLDGTVRAYDLMRYRNFRIFTAPIHTQFSSLAIDPSGDLVAAGSNDTYEIYIWSMQTGKLLDILSGHAAPVSGLAFSPNGNLLASSSWDRYTVLWDVFKDNARRETMFHSSDVLAVAYRSDSLEICTASLDGQLHFWDVETGSIISTIDGRKDIIGVRKETDKRKADTTPIGRHFTCVAYTPDGLCVLVGGQSKYICMYSIVDKLLLRKFTVSENRSLDGIFYDYKSMTEAGLPHEIEPDYESDESRSLWNHIPGATKKADKSKRHLKPAIRVRGIMVSPTSRCWAACTTEGLVVFSLDDTLIFDPIDLSIDITPESIRRTLESQAYLKALIMSFRLNEKDVIREVVEGTPPQDVQLVLQDFPMIHVKGLLTFLAEHLENSPHLEHYLTWLLHLFQTHGKSLKDNSAQLIGPFRSALKSLGQWKTDLSKMCTTNLYTLDYLGSVPKIKEAKVEVEDGNDDGESSEADEVDSDQDEVDLNGSGPLNGEEVSDDDGDVDELLIEDIVVPAAAQGSKGNKKHKSKQ